jgi:flagellar motor switch protein FliG
MRSVEPVCSFAASGQLTGERRFGDISRRAWSIKNLPKERIGIPFDRMRLVVVQTSKLLNEAGLRKAAILIMALPNHVAAQVVQRLPQWQIEAISVEIAQLDSVSGSEQESVMGEFMSSKASAIFASSGGLNRARDLLTEALGDQSASMLNQIEQAIESVPFGFVKKIDPQTLLTFIRDEHPQTLALLMSHLPGTYGAEVLSGLEPDKQLDVIRRIAAMRRTSPEATSELEKGLQQRLSNMVNSPQSQAGGVASVAEILNVAERSVERNVMEALGRDDPELSDDIRRLMFVFEDIAKLADRDIQSLLKNVETAQWAMALKGASQSLQEQSLQDKVLRNMSSRAADNLREEMEFLGKVRLAEVESVQQKIVDTVRHLEDTGELARPTGEEQDEYVS